MYFYFIHCASYHKHNNDGHFILYMCKRVNCKTFCFLLIVKPNGEICKCIASYIYRHASAIQIKRQKFFCSFVHVITNRLKSDGKSRVCLLVQQ